MKIIIAGPWQDAKGKQHKPGDKITVADSIARGLIRDGWARVAPAETKKAATGVTEEGDTQDV